MSATTELGFTPMKGTLYYLSADLTTTERLTGTFVLRDGYSDYYVSARRKGGRNSWHLCHVRNVVQFNEGEGWS